MLNDKLAGSKLVPRLQPLTLLTFHKSKAVDVKFTYHVHIHFVHVHSLSFKMKPQHKI